jgi:hypothetical protein
LKHKSRRDSSRDRPKDSASRSREVSSRT